jgi:formate hydrogenlyase subunit 3/multisubunit Na+/H+ antiporter MnhD subunit
MIGLDVRLPLGLLFGIIGALLCLQGLLGGSDHSGNINLWWGIVLVIFGALMLWLARRARAGSSPLP